MRLSSINVTCVLIILFLVSCNQNRDKNLYFDEGRVENGVYFNDSLKWKIQIPEGWNMAYQVKGGDNEVTKEKYKNNGNVMPQISNSIWLLSLEKDEFNVFYSSYNRLDSVNRQEFKDSFVSYREIIVGLYEPPVEVQSIGSITSEIVSGVSFLSFSYELYVPAPLDKKIYGVVYSGIIDSYYMEIFIMYTDLKNRSEIMNSWLQSSFTK